jgi:hypothetical protein
MRTSGGGFGWMGVFRGSFLGDILYLSWAVETATTFTKPTFVGWGKQSTKVDFAIVGATSVAKKTCPETFSEQVGF